MRDEATTSLNHDEQDHEIMDHHPISPNHHDDDLGITNDAPTALIHNHGGIISDTSPDHPFVEDTLEGDNPRNADKRSETVNTEFLDINDLTRQEMKSSRLKTPTSGVRDTEQIFMKPTPGDNKLTRECELHGSRSKRPSGCCKQSPQKQGRVRRMLLEP